MLTYEPHLIPWNILLVSVSTLRYQTQNCNSAPILRLHLWLQTPTETPGTIAHTQTTPLKSTMILIFFIMFGCIISDLDKNELYDIMHIMTLLDNNIKPNNPIASYTNTNMYIYFKFAQ